MNALEDALQTSARAGHSEHQLGTAVDLRSRNGPAAWDLEDCAATPEGAWVQQNAHSYGFVMGYPSGSELDSCYAYEPWHFRYVGPNVAEQIIERGLTPRQFLWQVMNQYRLADLQLDNEEMGSEDS